MKAPQKSEKAMTGPYSTMYGQDAYGHPTNNRGRCEQLNTTGICPTRSQQSTYLMNMPNNYVQEIATGVGINLGILGVLTNAVLVPLILNIQFPNG